MRHFCGPSARLFDRFNLVNLVNLFSSFNSALAAFFFLATSPAAEPTLEPKDLPRVPPFEATNTLKTFQIKKGFHLELAAAEPLLNSPIAMSFDENGRLFVVEMRDYSELREVHPHLVGVEV